MKKGQSRAKLTSKNLFEIVTGFAYLCKMIVLIQTFEGRQKIIFEIDFIVLELNSKCSSINIMDCI